MRSDETASRLWELSQVIDSLDGALLDERTRDLTEAERRWLRSLESELTELLWEIEDSGFGA